MHPVPFRKAAVRLYEYFVSFRKVARLLSVSIASVWRWCQRLEPKQRPHDSYTTKVTQAMVSLTTAHLLTNPCTTRAELARLLNSSFNTTLSKHAVDTVLKRANFSYKRTRLRGNSVRKHELMAAFLRTASQNLAHNPNVVAIDESSFDPRAKPLYGYAPKGQPAVVTTSMLARRPQRSCSLLMAVAASGESSHVFQQGGVNAAVFATFLSSLPFPVGTIILLDNASIHKTQAVRAAAAGKGYRLQFTPYSPETNPIELVFGVVKLKYYRARLAWRGTLEDCANHALSACTPEVVRQCFRHVVDRVWCVQNQPQNAEAT
jgi:transposase